MDGGMPPPPQRRRRPPESTRLTGRGWFFLLAVLGLGSAGHAVREPALVHLALFALVVVGAAGIIARQNVRGVEVLREAPQEVMVGREFLCSLRLRNDKTWMEARALEVADEMLGPFGRGCGVRRLGPGETAGVTLTTWLRERGDQPAFRWRISSAFPLGLWMAERRGRRSVPITVFPRAVPPQRLEEAEVESETAGAEDWLPQPDWSGDYLGIREFRSGDPLKMIHWRATARTQRLVVREFDRRLPRRVVICFHSYEPPGQPRLPDAFESALELLAGLLMQGDEPAVPMEMVADFLDWEPLDLGGGVRPALRVLAQARRRPHSDLEPLVRHLRSLPERSRVHVVSDTPVRLWRDLLPAAGCEVRCLSVSELRGRRQAPWGASPLTPSTA